LLLKTTLSDKQLLFSKKLRNRLIFTHKVCNFLFNKYRFLTSRKTSRLISKLILPKLTGTLICPTIFNFDLCLSKNNGEEIYFLGFYEVGTLNIIRKCLKPGDICIDVGSSIGMMSITSSFAVGEKGKVLAFEPDTKRYADLLNSLSINGITNIKAFNIGLGAEKKLIKLYKDRCSPSMIKINNNAPSETVEIQILDEILDMEQIYKVDFMKIDAEGFEIEVLKGAKDLLSQPNAPMLCIEYSKKIFESANLTETVFNFISAINDYLIYQLTKTSNTVSKLKIVSDENNLHKHDNIYCFLNYHLQTLPNDMFVRK